MVSLALAIKRPISIKKTDIVPVYIESVSVCNAKRLHNALPRYIISPRGVEISMPKMVNVNFRLEDDVKDSMEEVCAEMGISMSTAFKIFAKKVVKERRIPFELSADPFYSKSNMDYLSAVAKRINNGTANLVEHDLIEVEDE